MTDTVTDIRIDQVVDVDPNRVRVADNIRHDLGDLTDLTKSVAANGVLIPVLVVPVDGDPEHDYELRYGQRRRAAAVEAGRPLRAIVAAHVDDAAARIIEQLVENGHRKPLTVGGPSGIASDATLDRAKEALPAPSYGPGRVGFAVGRRPLNRGS